jgi:uncharacterized membrane protein
VGFSGALGQLILLRVLAQGPAYIIFPIICLSPVVTIILSVLLLHERAGVPGGVGITLAMAAIFLLSLQDPAGEPSRGYGWLFWSVAIFLMWGLQAYFMKSSSSAISSEGLFFYMAASALVLSPFAIYLTDFSAPINWGISGPGLTALIQVLNSVGALLLIYAIRAGKVIIVVPMINGLYPLITIVLYLSIYRLAPSRANSAGIVVALIAISLMAYDEVRHQPAAEPSAREVIR